MFLKCFNFLFKVYLVCYYFVGSDFEDYVSFRGGKVRFFKEVDLFVKGIKIDIISNFGFS